MKNPSYFLFALSIMWILACTTKDTPAHPVKNTRSVQNLKTATTDSSSVDPFTGLLVDDAHLPWAFQHGAGPKPPEAGFQTLHAFPPPPTPPIAPAPAPLQVTRVQPTGDVQLAGTLTIAFSQPMVPFASIQDTRQLPIPVKLDPAVPGRWRWMGTHLLAFEAETHFPFATHYVVKIPAGIQSQVGGKLEQEAQFSFSTPVLELTHSLPYSGDTHTNPDTVFLLYFNQKIDPTTLFPFVQVTSNGRSVPVRLLSRQEFEQNTFVKKHALSWQENRTLALLPEKLEKNTPYVITIKKGAPSAEGPRKTNVDQVVSFKTYGPFYVRQVFCREHKNTCRPGYEWEMELSNPIRIDPKEIDKFIKISPTPKELDINLSGMYGTISADFQPATRYTITIDSNLEDEYGQKLARPYVGVISVADAWPQLYMPTDRIAVVEASISRSLPVTSINILKPARVRLFTVSQEQIFDALKATRDYATKESSPPGDVLGQPTAVWEMPFNRKENAREMTSIDLNRALNKKNGLVFVEVKSMDLNRQDQNDSVYRQLLVNVTNVGLTVRYDENSIHALVTSLSDGKPLAGIPVKIFGHTPKGIQQTWEGVTRADGTLQAPGSLQSKIVGNTLVIAGDDNDKTFVILDSSGEDSGYVSSYNTYYTPPKHSLLLRAHVFTERDPYRPGETIHITGWLRSDSYGPKGKLEMLLYNKAELEWEIYNPTGEKVATGKTLLDQHGAFAVDYTPPQNAKLGQYGFWGTVRGVTGIQTPKVSKTFSVLAYRTPEHVVDVNIAPDMYIWGDTIRASISARYTFGAPMRKAEATYNVMMQKTTYRPPHHPDFAFGKITPYFFFECWYHSCKPKLIAVKSETGKLDDTGFWNLQFTAVAPDNQTNKEPSLLTLEANVTDVNRQSISARSSVLVHPARVYLGLRTQRNLIQAGEPFAVEGVVVDTAGTRIAGNTVKVRALLRTWKYVPPKKRNNEEDPWSSVDEEKVACTFTSANTPTSCKLQIDRAGFYILEGITTDEQGRKAITQRYLYVAGKDAVSWRQENQKKLKLVLDKEEAYRPGEKAKVLVQAPFYPAIGMLTVEREGIVSHRLIHVNNATHVEEISIEEAHIPNVHVAVALIRGRVKVPNKSDDDPGRPLLATGRVKIPISLDSRKVFVTLTPSKTVIKPGETIKLIVKTTDHKKQPIPARLAIMAVDEGILSLLGFTTPDPLAVFYPTRNPETALKDMRVHLLKKIIFQQPLPPPVPSARPSGIYKTEAGIDKALAREQKLESEPISLRKLFASTAYFNNQVQTDTNGVLQLSIPMPDNLTTFRIMAVAMDTSRPDRFGSSDTQVTVRKNFMLRASLPRFANYGDTFEAAVVLNTLLDKTGSAEVKMSGSNIELLGSDMQTVTFNAQKAQEVRFKVRASTPGKAVFTFTGRFLDETDGVQMPPIPIHVPVTTETTATYGMTDTSVAQPVVPPKNVLPQFGGLDVHLTSTALVNLQDAVRFIVNTEWECSEAIASRLVPLFALRDIIPAFKIGSAEDETRLMETAKSGVAKLLNYQHWNGGFTLFPSTYETWSFVSAYVTWALIRAKEAGFAVPDEVLRKAASFLLQVLQNKRKEYSWYYSYTTQIYAAWVLTEIQRLNLFTPQQMDHWQIKQHLQRLFHVRNEVGFVARAWLMHALWRVDNTSGDMVKQLAQEIENAVVETASSVHFAEVVTEGTALLMHSQARTDAVILRIFLEMYPQHPLLWKIAKGLMDARIKGDWGSTYANAIVLDALAAYFRTMEQKLPDFKINAWYNSLYAGTKNFVGRSMDIVHARIPMATLLKQGTGRLLLGKKGVGKLYFRLGLAYVPADLNVPPESQGLYVKRSYSATGNNDEVKLVAPGRWRVKAGATVQVSVRLIAQDRRHFVALEDPFPAGFEGVDMQLKTSAQHLRTHTSGAAVLKPSYEWWWHTPTHSEMRDDRFVAYYDRLYAGVYEYAYFVRATTIGTFHVPPTHALEMYNPEVFGRSTSEIVEVIP